MRTAAPATIVRRPAAESAIDAAAKDGLAGPQVAPRGAAGELTRGQLVAIGVAASLAGVSERTLRYYEEIGLVAPAAHSRGGSRRYAAEQVERVRRIRELQELLGLNLEEIRALLERDDRRLQLRAAWEASDDPESRRAILAEAITSNLGVRHRLLAKRERIDAVITELDERVEHLRQLLAQCAKKDAPRR